MYKENYGNNTRREGNSDAYKYRCEAREAPGPSPTSPTPFEATVDILELASSTFQLKVSGN
jgi:hypothetical protein